MNITESVNEQQNALQFTPEQQQAVHDGLERIIEAVRKLSDVLAELFERIRDAVVNLARYFLKLQLLEWKLPYFLAEFLSRNIYWGWALRLGFAYFVRKVYPKRVIGM